MKILKYFIISFLLFINVNVFALCDTTKLKELKDIADKIEFTYDYEFKEIKNSSTGILNDVVFTIKAYNLNQKIKPLIIKDYYTDDFKEFKYNSNNSSSLNGFKSGEKVVVTLKAYTTDECSGQTIATKTISLPYYNWFYHTEECLNNRDFKYCKTELLNINLDIIEFEEELKKYEDEKESNDDNSNEVNSKFSISNIFVIVIIVGSLLLLIFILIIKIKQGLKKKSL